MAPAPLLPRPDRLDRLVTILDAAAREEGWHQPHRLVSLEVDPAGPDPDDPDNRVPPLVFGFRALEPGQHPLDLLLGFVAPKAWVGLGVVCFGWAAPATDADLARGTAGTRPSTHPDRRRVRVIALIDRRGREQATATLDDGTVVDEPGSGTVSDALRRCLKLATPPPPVGTSEVFAAHWLQSVATGGPSPTWHQVAHLHPALRLLGTGGHRPRVEELVDRGRSLYRTLSWEELRLRTAAGHDDGLTIPADLAAWMDSGMFSRWVLAGLPPLPLLLHQCAELVDHDVLRRIRRTLRAWNLDPPLPRAEAEAS